MAKEFVLTDDMKTAILVLELAGYSVQFGDKTFTDGTKTFSVHKNGKKLYSMSSTTMLRPMSIMHDVILRDEFLRGVNAGTVKIQDEMKKLLGILPNS